MPAPLHCRAILCEFSDASLPPQFPEGDPEMGMDGEEGVGEGGVATEAPDAGEIDYADDEKDEV